MTTKGLSKKEIISIIQDHVGFLDITEDENSLGELYITECKFKEIEDLVIELKKKLESTSEREEFLINKIYSDKTGQYVEITDSILINKTFSLEGDLIFLKPKNVVLSNCSFINYQ